jgi:primosomal protein N' (replication factor Y)
VRVPLHGRRVRGWVVADAVAPDPDTGRLLPIAKVVGAGPPPDVLELARWAAHRWAGRDVALFRAATAPNAVREPWPLSSVLTPPGFGVEVVAWPPAADRRGLVAERVAPRGSTLVLVPDGTRLGSLVRDLQRRHHRVLVMRADVDDAARTLAWSAARRGGCVVVGGRTAVWAPVPDLASVVVLDEGDEALQEERAPTWQARDVAHERAARDGAAVTLVAPVPTPEAVAAGAEPVTRPRPAAERAGWPLVEVVDQREEPPGHGLLSEALAYALRRSVDAGDRAVCVLNRKGRAKLLTCRNCETVAACERCDAAVAEADAGVLACPRCGTTRPVICTRCHHTRLRASRLGVQRLRDALAALLPRTEIAWLDASVSEVGDAPVVVGTEAVLHRVPARLVAFLDLDQELFAHRVRAAQQAAGLVARAARVVGARERGGRMLLQTRAPEHPVVRLAVTGDPLPAMEAERARRRVLGFPPFGAVAELSGEPDPVRAALGVLPTDLRVLGPSAQGSGVAALAFAPDPDRLADALAVAGPAGRAEGRLRVAVDPPRV